LSPTSAWATPSLPAAFATPPPSTLATLQPAPSYAPGLPLSSPS
jgi:hypothetical protein